MIGKKPRIPDLIGGEQSLSVSENPLFLYRKLQLQETTGQEQQKTADSKHYSKQDS